MQSWAEKDVSTCILCFHKMDDKMKPLLYLDNPYSNCFSNISSDYKLVTNIEVCLDLCMSYGQLQPSIWRTLGCKTTQISYMVVDKHGVLTFKVVVNLLLLFRLLIGVFVHTNAHTTLFLDKCLVQIYLYACLVIHLCNCRYCYQEATPIIIQCWY